MFNNKEIILDYVQKEGPVLPIQVAKKINSNTMFAGAILSELIANKFIKISYAKIGSSPVYYAQGQEEKLSILYEHLPGKEKEAFNILKNNKILLDDIQEPSIRFALSQIRDFSIPFLYNLNNNNIKCWRWHLINEDEALKLLNELLFKEEPKKDEVIQEITKEENKEVLIEFKNTNKEYLENEKIKYEQIKELVSDAEIKKEALVNIRKNKTETIDQFLVNIQNYLSDKNIKILETQIIKKNKDIEIIASIPTTLGELSYLIKAVDKKLLNDKDIILAHNKGNLIKKPVILLSNGNISKKAEKYINQNLSGYLTFKNLD